MHTNTLRLSQSIAVVASSLGLLCACGLGALVPSPPPPPALPQLGVSADRITLEPTAADPKPVATLTVENLLDDPARLLPPQFADDDGHALSVTTTCAAVLDPHRKCTVTVSADSSQERRRPVTLVLGAQRRSQQEFHDVRITVLPRSAGTPPRPVPEK